jgi:hypothetical protein
MSFQKNGLADVLLSTRKKSVEVPLCHFFLRQRGFDEGRWTLEVTLMQSTAMISKVFFSDAELTSSAGVWLPCSF